MKYFYLYIFVFFLSLPLLPCRALEADDGNLIITNEKKDDGKKAVTSLFVLNADPEKVYQTLRNVEAFTEFMPGAAKVEVLESGEGYQIVKFIGSRGLLSGDIVMKRIMDNRNRRIEWNLVDGPLREVSGYWFIEPDHVSKQGSVVHYSNYVDAGVLIPAFIVRKILREDIQKMVPNIIKRVESGGNWVSAEYMKKK